MDRHDVEKAICRRTLSVDGGDDINVYIWAPIRLNDDEYVCDYKIDGIGHVVNRHSTGIDAFQSLIFALRMIGTYLNSSEQHKGGLLSWDGDYTDFGFPVYA